MKKLFQKFKFFPILLMGLISSNFVFAQTSDTPKEGGTPMSAPIPLEVFLGSENWTSQIIVDKKFLGSQRFGLFALSYLRANYDNDPHFQESMNLALLKSDVIYGLSVLTGAAYSSVWGFRPYAGGQYNFHTPTVLLSLTSGMFLTESQNFETLAIAEYRPKLTETLSLYTHIQGLYNINNDTDKHDRSYVYTRVGLSYLAYSFGFAFNYDRYGPMKIEDKTMGVFLSTVLP